MFGAFLLFCVPIGGGIPAGVLMARAANVSHQDARLGCAENTDDEEFAHD